ncbi:hypothetical protein ACP4OV_024562 [Aristida adscensionis]
MAELLALCAPWASCLPPLLPGTMSQAVEASHAVCSSVVPAPLVLSKSHGAAAEQHLQSSTPQSPASWMPLPLPSGSTVSQMALRQTTKNLDGRSKSTQPSSPAASR